MSEFEKALEAKVDSLSVDGFDPGSIAKGARWAHNWLIRHKTECVKAEREYQDAQAEIAALKKRNAELVEALKLVKELNSYQAMTCLPINVREQDGSITQHRPKSIAGEIDDILNQALTKLRGENG